MESHELATAKQALGVMNNRFRVLDAAVDSLFAVAGHDAREMAILPSRVIADVDALAVALASLTRSLNRLPGLSDRYRAL